MNEKLSLQDLIDLLAQKAQISKKESDLFLREFFQLILERIYENEPVRIKDFGTFKLTLISARESVNVNTGEKIKIPSHFRLGFHPDKVLKDLVNLPFSKYEAVILEDGVEPSDIVFEEKESINVEDDIDISKNIVKKTIEDQVDLINEFRNKNAKATQEPKPPFKESRQSLPDDASKERYTKSAKPKSFVYTYVITSKDDAQNDNTVTLVVPKEKFLITDSSEIDEEIKSEEREQSFADNDRVSSHQDEFEKVINQEEEDTDYEYLEDQLADGNQQDIEDEEDPELVVEDEEKKTVDFSEFVLDSSSEEENIVEIIDSEEIHSDDHIENLEVDTELNDTAEEDKILSDKSIISEVNNHPENLNLEADDISEFQFLSDDDPDRPLLPDNDRVEKKDAEQINSKDSHNVAINKKNQDMEKPNVDTQEELEDDSFFYHPQPSFKDKLKKRLPLILIIVIALVFTIYSFAKLFDVKYDYEKYLGNKNLTLADTLPLMGDDTSISLADSSRDLLITDSVLNTSTDNQTKISDDVAVLNNPTETKTNADIDDVSGGIVLDGTSDYSALDSTSFYINKKNKRISKNLNFEIINKAQFFVQKNAKSDLQAENQNKSSEEIEVQDLATVSLQKGMTLRSLAAKYYGNSIYWVYIYEANRAILPNPNTLSIGMKLIIPDLSQYGITNIKNQDAIKKAQQLEIKYL